ncbi:DUF1178 family protein [Bradyrhizobium sp. 2TAF24]|uniref:DUF1178 family protein n=1 Tax=Bradyrhizobium sp. 2TAF24 TaxID=3233011 RepID=UPI003F8F203C
MIRYALHCDKGHSFESWFQDSAAYDSQRKRKLVACPACDSTEVEKALMAPQLPRKSNAKAAAARPAAAETPVPAEAVPLVSAQELELRAKLKELRDHIVSRADNVGDSFPTEARKMHYGDIEHRPIYGEATIDEARALVDEGIEVAPLPVLPDDRN